MNELTPTSQATELAAQQAQFLGMIERVAANPDADIDKLERLLDMQERVANAHKQQAFNAAMAQMQLDMPVIEKSGVIAVKGQLRSKYARYEDIMKQVKPILSTHGFAVSFRTDNTQQGFISITGVLMHNQGWREETSMTLPYDQSGSKNVVQAIGSSTSYGKRYVLCSLLNIATGDEDDDAQSAFISTDELSELEKDIRTCETIESLRDLFAKAYRAVRAQADKARIKNAYDLRKDELLGGSK